MPIGDLVSRAMALQKRQGGSFFFVFNKESGKFDDLKSDGHVNLSFLKETGEWVSVSGFASLVSSPSTLHELFTPSVSVWFKVKSSSLLSPVFCLVQTKI